MKGMGQFIQSNSAVFALQKMYACLLRRDICFIGLSLASGTEFTVDYCITFDLPTCVEVSGISCCSIYMMHVFMVLFLM